MTNGCAMPDLSFPRRKSATLAVRLKLCGPDRWTGMCPDSPWRCWYSVQARRRILSSWGMCRAGDRDQSGAVRAGIYDSPV